MHKHFGSDGWVKTKSGIPDLKFDKRADKVGRCHDSSLRSLRSNSEKLSTNIKEIRLARTLVMNKLEADHDINRYLRNQREMNRRQKNMGDLNNANINKLNNEF